MPHAEDVEMSSPSSEAELSVVLDCQLELGSSGIIHDHRAGVVQKRAEIERLLSTSSAVHEKQRGLRYLRESRSSPGANGSLTRHRLDDRLDRRAGCDTGTESSTRQHRRRGDPTILQPGLGTSLVLQAWNRRKRSRDLAGERCGASR